MNIVVTGSAGFFGSYVTNYLIEQGHKVIGLDNLSRRGSELNAKTQRNNLFMEFHECDVSDKIALDSCLKEKEIDWIVDCAADPSVMAGLDGKSMGVINNNLITTINLLEICKNKNAGFILMSTSRVYSIADLVNLEINEDENPKRFTIPIDNEVSEKFSTKPPISLYGSTKLTSELLAIEYGNMYNLSLLSQQSDR